MQRDSDFRLTVWYHGLKATQYFSKFTQQSIAELKKDLTILGLPQPKNQNITLLSHGAVECFWPAAGMNSVLHKNLVVKTNKTPAFHEAINRLSILSISVKETSAPHSPFPSDSVKQTSLKRPYEQRASTSVSAVPMGQLVDTCRGHQTSRNHDTSGYRPQPAHSSAVIPSYSFAYDDSSRPTKVAKTHSQGFQLPAKSVNNGHPRNSFEPPPPTSRSQPSTSTTTLTNSSSRVNPPCPPTRLATHSASRMDLQPLRMPSNPSSNVSGVEREWANAFLNNLELQPTASGRDPPRQPLPLPRKPLVSASNGPALSNGRTESQGRTAGVASDKIPGRKTPNSTAVKTAVQAPTLTPSTSAPSHGFHSSYTNLQSNTPLPTPVSPWLDSKSVHQLVHKTTEIHGSTTSVTPPTPTAIDAKGPGTYTALPAVMNPATPQLAMGLKEVSRNIGEWFAEGHGVPRKDIRQDREKELELEKLIEELKEVKKELEEERRSRREDKELLDVERQRREEAEHALADVRRECRQPFVVPSLLDAFVELSKLTTRGLKVSGSQVEVQGPREVEGASRAVNGRDVAASHKVSSPPVGVEWTKVKLEPLDDQLL